MIEDPEKAKPDESELSVHVSKIDIFPCKKPDDESSGRAVTPSTLDGAHSKDDAENPVLAGNQNEAVSEISDNSYSEAEDRSITKINSLIKIKPTEKETEIVDQNSNFAEESEDSAVNDIVSELDSSAAEATKGCCCCRRTKTGKLGSVGPVPKLSKQLTQDLMKVQSTKFICTKPFDQMNPVEKSERIKFLWRKLRASVRFLKSMGSGARDQALLEGVDLDELYDVDDAHARVRSQYRWYILRTDQLCIQAWSLFINFLTIYALFSTPYA